MSRQAALLTIGNMLDALPGAKRHQLEYLLDHRDIAPVARAGKYRLYHPSAIEKLRRALAEIAERQAEGAVA